MKDIEKKTVTGIEQLNSDCQTEFQPLNWTPSSSNSPIQSFNIDIYKRDNDKNMENQYNAISYMITC